MPVVNVNIQPAILSWALSQTDKVKLGEKLMNNIDQWLNGSKTPTFNQIEEFSRKANIPIGYFFLQTPPVEKIKILEFRTIDSIELANPSRNFIDTVTEMENIQNWMIDYRKDTGFGELSYVGSINETSSINDIVNKIRADLELPVEWQNNCNNMDEAFTYVRSLLEQCGTIVMLNGIVGKNTHRALSIEEFRAFTLIDKWAPLIFINGTDSKGAKLFSLFHELVHIWLGVDDLFNDRRSNTNVKPIETICNAVAGELMIPTGLFLDAWKMLDAELDEKIATLARRFKCSEVVVARKALDNNKIIKGIYDNIVNESIEALKKSKENKVTSGGNYYNTMGTRLDRTFVRALCESVQIGRTSYTEACRLTNTNRKTFPKVAIEMGGVV